MFEAARARTEETSTTLKLCARLRPTYHVLSAEREKAADMAMHARSPRTTDGSQHASGSSTVCMYVCMKMGGRGYVAVLVKG